MLQCIIIGNLTNSLRHLKKEILAIDMGRGKYHWSHIKSFLMQVSNVTSMLLHLYFNMHESTLRLLE